MMTSSLTVAISSDIAQQTDAGPFVYFAYQDTATGRIVESPTPIAPGSTFVAPKPSSNYGVVVKWNPCLEDETETVCSSSAPLAKAIALFPVATSTATKVIYGTKDTTKKLFTVQKAADGSVSVLDEKALGVVATTQQAVTWTFTNGMIGVNNVTSVFYVSVGIYEADDTGKLVLVQLQKDGNPPELSNPFMLSSVSGSGASTSVAVTVTNFYYVRFTVTIDGPLGKGNVLWEAICTPDSLPLNCVNKNSDMDVPIFQMLPSSVYDKTLVSNTPSSGIDSNILMACVITTTGPTSKTVQFVDMPSSATLQVSPTINCYADWTNLPAGASTYYNKYDSYMSLLNNAPASAGTPVSVPYPCFQWYVINPYDPDSGFQEWSSTNSTNSTGSSDDFWGSSTRTFLTKTTDQLFNSLPMPMYSAIRMRVVVNLYIDEPVNSSSNGIQYTSKPVPNTAPIVCDFDMYGYNVFRNATAPNYQYVSDTQGRRWFKILYSFAQEAQTLTLQINIVTPDEIEPFYSDPFDFRSMNYMYMYSLATNDVTDFINFDSSGTIPSWAPFTPGAVFNLSTLYDTADYLCSQTAGGATTISAELLTGVSPQNNTNSLMVMPFDFLTCTAHISTVGKTLDDETPAAYDQTLLFPGFPVATFYGSDLLDKSLLGLPFQKGIQAPLLQTSDAGPKPESAWRIFGTPRFWNFFNFGVGSDKTAVVDPDHVFSAKDYLFSFDIIPNTNYFCLSNARYGPLTLAQNVFYTHQSSFYTYDPSKGPDSADSRMTASGGFWSTQNNVLVSQAWCPNGNTNFNEDLFSSSTAGCPLTKSTDVQCALPDQSGNSPQFTVIWSLASSIITDNLSSGCAAVETQVLTRTAPELMILFRTSASSKVIYVIGNGFVTSYENSLYENRFFPSGNPVVDGYNAYFRTSPATPTCARAFAKYDTASVNPPFFKSWLPYGGFCGYPLPADAYPSTGRGKTSSNVAVQIQNAHDCGGAPGVFMVGSVETWVKNFHTGSGWIDFTPDSGAQNFQYMFDSDRIKNGAQIEDGMHNALLSTTAHMATAFKLVLTPFSDILVQQALKTSGETAWLFDATADALAVVQNAPNLCSLVSSGLSYPTWSKAPSSGGPTATAQFADGVACANCCDTNKPDATAPGFDNPLPVINSCVAADTVAGAYNYQDFYSNNGVYRTSSNALALYEFIDRVCFPNEAFQEQDGYTCPIIMGQKTTSCSGATSLNFRQACEAIGGISTPITDEIAEYYAKRAVEYCNRPENAASPECACLRAYDTPVLYPGPPPVSFTQFVNETPGIETAAFPTCLWPGCWPRQHAGVMPANLSKIYSDNYLGGAIVLGPRQNQQCPLDLTTCLEGITNAEITNSSVVINLINVCSDNYCSGNACQPSAGPASLSVQVLPEIGGELAAAPPSPASNAWLWGFVAVIVLVVVLATVLGLRWPVYKSLRAKP